MAGITTFMTMAYILAVNPNILSASGMDSEAVLIATALASFVGTALMALLANYPFALAPGMGLNAYFSYTVVLTMGYSWQLALMAVFVEGIIFIVLSLTNVREGIFNAIPMTLKSAVSVGIGLFVAFVGLQNAKLIVNSDSTLVTYQHFKGDTFSSVGVGAILALLGIVITAVLLVKKVKGGILYGILITWGLGILCEIAGIYVPNPDAGMYSVIPTAFVSFDFSALGKTFGQVFKTDFSGVGILNFFAVMFSFLFVDLFDTLGTLIGVASKADMLDQDGKLPHIKGALLADSIATCAGAVLGTSTTTTFVESASGVTEGGRTGLTAMTTGILFLLATIFFIQHHATITGQFGKLGLCISILILLAMGGGVVLSKSMRLNRKEQRTLIIEIGMQNAAQAIAVASSPFVFNNDIIAIPAIIYALVMNVILLIYVGVVKRQR